MTSRLDVAEWVCYCEARQLWNIHWIQVKQWNLLVFPVCWMSLSVLECQCHQDKFLKFKRLGLWDAIITTLSFILSLAFSETSACQWVWVSMFIRWNTVDLGLCFLPGYILWILMGFWWILAAKCWILSSDNGVEKHKRHYTSWLIPKKQ